MKLVSVASKLQLCSKTKELNFLDGSNSPAGCQLSILTIFWQPTLSKRQRSGVHCWHSKFSISAPFHFYFLLNPVCRCDQFFKILATICKTQILATLFFCRCYLTELFSRVSSRHSIFEKVTSPMSVCLSRLNRHCFTCIILFLQQNRQTSEQGQQNGPGKCNSNLFGRYITGRR